MNETINDEEDKLRSYEIHKRITLLGVTKWEGFFLIMFFSLMIVGPIWLPGSLGAYAPFAGVILLPFLWGLLAFIRQYLPTFRILNWFIGFFTHDYYN